jgi:hypothetical protein
MFCSDPLRRDGVGDAYYYPYAYEWEARLGSD